tara:strand:- start:7024 stop:8649 length:1626 start_codon:yes stop_codon:yes gene_type:complete
VFKKLKKIIDDTLYVSKITKTGRKKITILTAVVFSQLIAFVDILIILVFTYLLTGAFETSENLKFLENVMDYTPVLPLVIILRYSFQYFQSSLLRNMELNVQTNLKTHLLEEVFDKRNYSVADAYYYINTLTSHVSFFYSSIANLMNYLLQTFAFAIYLFMTEPRTIGTFSLGILFLLYPISYLINRAREYMHKSYELGQDANHEIQRVVDNMFLIKLLKKESIEIKRFENTLINLKSSVFNNYKFTILNSYLPSFVTIFLLSVISIFFSTIFKITLDFVGVTLRMFQSLGMLSNAVNQIVNSHVHLEKFNEIQNTKQVLKKDNYKLSIDLNDDHAFIFKNVDFSYINNDSRIFKNINFSIKKNTHTIVTGSNGSGKSTLLGLMAGVYYPTNGVVETHSDRFGFIGPTPLIFSASLRDNIMYGNENVADDKLIFNYINDFELFNDEFSISLDKKIDNKSLSSGQMQKIAFIRALIADIDVLFLDESTSNLDSKSKDKIFQILKDQKVTIINSTHEQKNFNFYDHHLEIEIEEDNRLINQIK